MLFKSLSTVFIASSINSLFFTGILMLFIFIIFIANFRQFLKLNYYQKILLLSVMTIAIGVHGLIHLGVEVNYGFNPFNWI